MNSTPSRDSNQALIARRQAAVARAVATATAAFASQASGVEVWDCDGRRYIDFAGGIGALATGQRHPNVVTRRDGAEPNGVTPKLVTACAFERGLLLLTCGTYGETIRIPCPFTIADAQLEEGRALMQQALMR